MSKAKITPQRRQVLELRHRDAAWSRALLTLFDDEHSGLSMAHWLAREGVGQLHDALTAHVSHGHALVAAMTEARPFAAAAVEQQWADHCAALHARFPHIQMNPYSGSSSSDKSASGTVTSSG